MFGTAKIDITPKGSCFMAGYFHDRETSEADDPIHAKALVIGEGDSRIAIVSCDLVSISSYIAQPAKELIKRQTGLAGDRVLITATHTHTGPAAGGCTPYSPQWANDEYDKELSENIAKAVKVACDNMFDGTLHYGITDAPGYAFNRLQRFKNGMEIFGTGTKEQENEIIGPAGPVDSSVQTITVRDTEGNVRIVAVNFACHANVIGRGKNISADWPGEMMNTIENSYSPDCVCLFLQGTAGDIMQRDFEHEHYMPQSGYRKSRQMGRGIAGAAMQSLEPAEDMKSVGTDAHFEYIEIPYYTRTPEFTAHVEKLRAKPDDDTTYFETHLIRRFDRWENDGKIAKYPVQCFRVGDVAIVGVSGEIFTRLGLEIKKYSPAEHTIIIELSNERVTGYVATTDQANRGAYGTIPILSRYLHADAGRLIVEAAIRNLHKLWD